MPTMLANSIHLSLNITQVGRQMDFSITFGVFTTLAAFLLLAISRLIVGRSVYSIPEMWDIMPSI